MATIDLSGPGGNAFALMSNVNQWCKQLKKDPAPILRDMQSGDYYHLLDVIDKEFYGVITWINDPRKETDNEED